MYPILFQYAGIEIHTYPIVSIVGFLMSSWFFVRAVRRRDLNLDFVTDYWFFILFFVLAFSRLGSTLTEDTSSYFFILDGEFHFYFGILGLVIALLLAGKKSGEDPYMWMDRLTIPFAVMIVFLCIAEFLSGVHYGTVTDISFGVVYAIPEVRYTAPVHPVQMYQLIYTIISLGILGVYRKRFLHSGVLFFSFLFLYFLGESLWYFLDIRYPIGIFIADNYPLSMILSVVFALMSFLAMISCMQPYKR